MPKVAYTDWNPKSESLDIVRLANKIIREYAAQGFTLTLRQLYYQFVARDWLPNKQAAYNRLGGIISRARLAGLVDWDAIEDRTRFVRKKPVFESPQEMLEACAGTVDSYIWPFSFDMWENQTHRIEVWIEKDALIGVIEGVCHDLDIPFFSCRGYTSQSELWRAGRRLGRWRRDGQIPVVLHLGDHDPSGIDMTRDVHERVALFAECPVKVDRLALNFDQVQQYDPPPNPAKETDSRSDGYIQIYGTESWELDALEPAVMADLIRDAVVNFRDEDAWEEAVVRRDEARETFGQIADQWDEVRGFVGMK